MRARREPFLDAVPRRQLEAGRAHAMRNPGLHGHETSEFPAGHHVPGTQFEVSIEWQPIEHVGIAIGYGIAGSVIERVVLVPPQDAADVQAQGLVVGMTLQF